MEVDRRLAEKRISDLRKQLRAIEHRRQREVAARRTQMTVSLVGYTNAGKSTLLNALTGADVFTKDCSSPRSTRGPAAGNCPAGGRCC